MHRFPRIIACLYSLIAACLTIAAPRTLEPGMHHLRGGGDEREWTQFPQQAQSAELTVTFNAQANASEQTLWIRQQDVKQTWAVLLNGKRLIVLENDENDLRMAHAVPPGALIDGANMLRIINERARLSDDIRVGEIQLDDRPIAQVLGEGRVRVTIRDLDDGSPLPARVTIVDGQGSLISCGAASDERLAVRAGKIYTADGVAEFGLPAGEYTLYASRGFEYSIDRKQVRVREGITAYAPMRLRREVDTAGLVACDTHVHTFTYSRHGDATLTERMISIAGEGIELPIATDHNQHIDYEAEARRIGVRQYFTPVIGNEVTTRVGHFNVFPVASADTPVPDAKLTDWGAIADAIYSTANVKVMILNHARDLHGSTRPFGPKLHNAVVGENLLGWPMRFNAMELINSGATQSDGMRLTHDWMGLLNRGLRIAPIGSSDSHDVARHMVGQGRTYIAVDDSDPGRIDVAKACQSIIEGRTIVSFGLLPRMRVNRQFVPGDLAGAAEDEIEVEVTVLGPSWTTADRVMLFMNGRLVREETFTLKDSGGEYPIVKRQSKWKLPRPEHDVFLVAVARGPGESTSPFWTIPKAYQPTSPDWRPYVMGVTGAVWVDGDGDGVASAAHAYAQRLLREAEGDLNRLINSLKRYDAATAAHAANLLTKSGLAPDDVRVKQALERANAVTREGFAWFEAAWRENQAAQQQP